MSVFDDTNDSCSAEFLTGLSGCKNISDDIIVYGRDVREHDENLNRILTRLQEHNTRLNQDKCTFRKSEVTFYGYSFSAEGIKAAPPPEGQRH